jgi:hypothetical protein
MLYLCLAGSQQGNASGWEERDLKKVKINDIAPD